MAELMKKSMGEPNLFFVVRSLRNLFQRFRQSLFRGLSWFFGKKFNTHQTKVALVVAPHPDDEAFGLGGLLANLALRSSGLHSSSKCYVVFVTSGGASHLRCCKMSVQVLGERRELVARKCADMLGVRQQNIRFLRLQDGQIPHFPEPGFDSLVGMLLDLINEIRPDTLFVPHPLEGWADHEAATAAVMAAVSRVKTMLPANSSACLVNLKIYYYCVWFWYSLPLRVGARLRWRDAITFNLVDKGGPDPIAKSSESYMKIKRAAVQLYLEDRCECGKPTCGNLPPQFLSAFDWDHELFFPADP